jgi:hypothetical protein
LLIAIPIAAHLLRRGKTKVQAFPPTALVPAARSVARERSRLEDRALLTLRGLLILALAVLGATPLVRCSRLSLNRDGGASVAFAIIVDDSESMRAETSEGVRFKMAQDAARELLASAREGDAVAIVLGGYPARLGLAATTDLTAARRAFGELSASDRATDIDGAVQIARTSIAQLPHRDKRVILLSDLAGAPIPTGKPQVWTPVDALTNIAPNCAITSAERRARRVTASVACTSANVARDRSLKLTSTEAGAKDLGASHQLLPQPGVQTVSLEVDTKVTSLDAELTGKDSLASDDKAPVAPEFGALVLAVNVDTSRSSAATGGPPILEQALSALDTDAVVRPIPVIPDDPGDLSGFGALILDDPSGLPPEARVALTEWVNRGGVAVALLGPRAKSLQLGSTLEPFVHGAANWEATTAKGVAPDSLSWLGAEASSLAELAPKHRVRLDGTELPGAQAIAQWDDGKPFIVERKAGRGIFYTVSLPSSIEESDFALRPGFVALLDHFIATARDRSGPRRSNAGTEWVFPAGANVQIAGPKGALDVKDSGTRPGSDAQKTATPAFAGRYDVRINGEKQTRIVTIDPEEITAAPRQPEAATAQALANAPSGQVDVSNEMIFILALLLAVELAFRVYRMRGAASSPHNA